VIGIAGTGKSTDLNYILMELLRHLDEDGWPSKVGLRLNEKLYEFSLSGVTESKMPFSVLDGYSSDGVLIVELEEKEKDPIIRYAFLSSTTT